MKKTRLITLCLSITALITCGGCTHTRTAEVTPRALTSATPATTPPADSAVVAATIDGVRIPAGQLLVVVAEGNETSRAVLYRLERGDNGWRMKGGAVDAMVGRNGFARPGEKRGAFHFSFGFAF